MTFPHMAPFSTDQLAALWLPLLLDVSIKGTFILGLAALMLLALRRASAAIKHLVLLLALTSLLILPAVSGLLPGWRVLPSWARMELPTPAKLAAPPRPMVAARPIVDRAAAISAPEPATTGEMTRFAPAANETDGAGPSVPHSLVAAGPVPTPAPATAIAALPSRIAQIIPWVLTLWALGVVVFLVPQLVGRIAVWRLRRQCQPITSGRLFDLTSKAKMQMGLRRPVALLISSRRPMPMMWGIVRPTLLLPAEAASWSTDRLWSVLLHELGHVQRHDMLTKLLANLAAAVYWFNPLVWWALRRFQTEAEQACDDLVLTSGGAAHSDPRAYAQHILEIASGLQSEMFAVHGSIALARPNKLEHRLVAILDPRRNRRSLTRLTIAILLAAAAVLLLPLAMLRPARAEKPGAAAGLSSTTQPATQATIERDTATPRAAMLAMFDAMEKHDSWASAELLDWSEPEVMQAAQLSLRLCEADLKLSDAAQRTFGPAAKGGWLGNGNTYQSVRQDIRAAQEKITGDFAVLSDAKGNEMWRLHKMDDGWRVVPYESWHKFELDNLGFLAAKNRVADDILAGKIKTAAEAQAAVVRHMDEVRRVLGPMDILPAFAQALPERPAATQAGVQPAATGLTQLPGSPLAQATGGVYVMNGQAGAADNTVAAELARREVELRLELEPLRERYSPNHRVVMELEAKLQALAKVRAEMGVGAGVFGPPGPPGTQPADFVPDRSETRLGTGDLLTITVFGLVKPNQDWVQTRRVNEAGNLLLPDIGLVKVKGLTEKELTDEVVGIIKQKGLLKDPAVQVILQDNVHNNTFSVLGGARAGNYSVPQPDFRLTEALAAAGGVQGHGDYVRIIRRTGGDNQRVMVIPVAPLLAGEANLNIIIRWGDVIVFGDALTPPRVGARAGAGADAATQPAASGTAPGAALKLNLPGPEDLVPGKGDAGKNIYIHGQVGRPGTYSIPVDGDNFRLLQALAGIGRITGPVEFVRITRRTSNNQERVIDVPLAPLLAGDASLNIVVRGDDFMTFRGASGASGAATSPAARPD